jgi:hypothetical protein
MEIAGPRPGIGLAYARVHMRKQILFCMGAAALCMSACVDDAPTGDELDVDSADSGGKADAPGSESYTFLTARRDVRACAFPMCGGYWVSRVNRATLQCGDGHAASECYVAEIDWSATGLTADQIDGARGAHQPLYRGTIATRTYDTRTFGVLAPTEVWAANNDLEPYGVFARVTDSGITCVRAPCNSLHEAKLNAALDADIAELDFEPSGANDDELSKAADAIASTDGLLVAGYRYWYREHGTWAKGRDVSQLWRRILPAGGHEGELCGSRGIPAECAAGLYCARDLAAQCGQFDAPGTCEPIPDACDEVYDPACGCDGTTYGNACEAASAGVSVLHAGAC